MGRQFNKETKPEIDLHRYMRRCMEPLDMCISFGEEMGVGMPSAPASIAESVDYIRNRHGIKGGKLVTDPWGVQELGRAKSTIKKKS